MVCDGIGRKESSQEKYLLSGFRVKRENPTSMRMTSRKSATVCPSLRVFFSDHLTRGGIFSLPTFPRILRTVRIVTKVCLDNRFGIFVLLDFSWRIFRRVERDSSSMITFQSSDGVAIISRRSQKVYTRSLGRCPRSSQKNCHESEWTRMLDGADYERSHL